MSNQSSRTWSSRRGQSGPVLSQQSGRGQGAPSRPRGLPPARGPSSHASMRPHPSQVYAHGLVAPPVNGESQHQRFERMEVNDRVTSDSVASLAHDVHGNQEEILQRLHHSSSTAAEDSRALNQSMHQLDDSINRLTQAVSSFSTSLGTALRNQTNAVLDLSDDIHAANSHNLPRGSPSSRDSSSPSPSPPRRSMVASNSVGMRSPNGHSAPTPTHPDTSASASRAAAHRRSRSTDDSGRSSASAPPRKKARDDTVMAPTPSTSSSNRVGLAARLSEDPVASVIIGPYNWESVNLADQLLDLLELLPARLLRSLSLPDGVELYPDVVDFTNDGSHEYVRAWLPTRAVAEELVSAWEQYRPEEVTSVVIGLEGDN